MPGEQQQLVPSIAGTAPCSQFHRNCTCRECTTYVTLRTGATAERNRIAGEIDERIEAGRGSSEAWPEAMALDWCKRNIVLQGQEHGFEASRPKTCPRCGAADDAVEPGEQGNHQQPHIPDRYYYACGHSVFEDYRDGTRVWVEVSATLAPNCPGRQEGRLKDARLDTGDLGVSAGDGLRGDAVESAAEVSHEGRLSEYRARQLEPGVTLVDCPVPKCGWRGPHTDRPAHGEWHAAHPFERWQDPEDGFGTPGKEAQP